MSEYYFNTETHQVENGRQSSSLKLMGPYPSYAEAARALEIAQERNEAADRAAKEWDKAWDDDDWDDDDWDDDDWDDDWDGRGDAQCADHAPPGN